MFGCCQSSIIVHNLQYVILLNLVDYLDICNISYNYSLKSKYDVSQNFLVSTIILKGVYTPRRIQKIDFFSFF